MVTDAVVVTPAVGRYRFASAMRAHTFGSPLLRSWSSTLGASMEMITLSRPAWAYSSTRSRVSSAPFVHTRDFTPRCLAWASIPGRPACIVGSPPTNAMYRHIKAEVAELASGVARVRDRELAEAGASVTQHSLEQTGTTGSVVFPRREKRDDRFPPAQPPALVIKMPVSATRQVPAQDSGNSELSHL